MRKIVLFGMAALGFLAVGMTVLGQPAGGANGQANLSAMVDGNRTGRPLLVAMSLYSPTDTGTG